MTRMNSTSLYITTNQIILKSDPDDPSSWEDLYRLAPYLRNSLCCVVCGNLLIDPLTPAAGKCQHHLCRKCKGGRKKIKPACVWCKECNLYKDNKALRILLQCYKKMCIMLINSGIFLRLAEQAAQSNFAVGVERGAGNLIMLIKEGAAFEDDYELNVGLSKSVYSILPCIYTNSTAQNLQVAQTENNRPMLLNSNLQNVPNGSSLYSVMYAGGDNKLTIKRKSKELPAESKVNRTMQMKKDICNKGMFKRPGATKCVIKSRRGCRCGNATATPGKLTCCGQRCPCYVESKPCIECKCRGCRNPHRPDGNKVRAHTPHLELFQPIMYEETPQQNQPSLASPPSPTPLLQPILQQLQQELLQPQDELFQCQQELLQVQQELLESQQELLPPQQELLPPQQELLPSQQELFQPQQELLHPQQELLQPQQEVLQPQQELFQPQQQQLVFQLRKPPLLQNINVELDTDLTLEQLNEHLMVANFKVLDSYTKISASLPHAILMNEELSENEEDISIDV